MPRTPQATSGHPGRWALGSAAAVILLVAATVLIWAPSGDEEEVPSSAQPTSPSLPTPEEPLVVTNTATLKVPDTLRMDSDDFETEAGDTYLLQFEATAAKPAGSPGDAMYFGANLACGGPEGGTLRSVGGTQNVRSGEQVTIGNQFLLTIEESGSHACRLSVSSPNEEAAAVGTEVAVDTQWSAARVDEPALEAPADERLPRLVEDGERAAAFRVEIDLEEFPDREFDLLGTLHLTTCTGTNGSREDGTTWCAKDDVDSEGSDVEVTYRTDVLDSSGEVCASTVNVTTRVRIERFTHHRILHVDLPSDAPLSTCGDTARVVIAVQNDGPAPVVVHRSTSTLLLLPSS